MDFRNLRKTLSGFVSRRTPDPVFDSHPYPPVFPVPIKPGYEYEVFLSFRGPDTRKTFTDHLYNDLIEAGVRTFRDSEELQAGEGIGTVLLEAISQSKISIPVFSKGYASSKWCLLELAQMVECTKSKEHKIIPVFLDVTPCEVRHQGGHYQKAFEDHEKNSKIVAADVQKWRETLETVGALKGLDMEIASGYQGRLSKMVVSTVFKELKRQQLDVPEDLVGIDEHVDVIMNLADIQDEEGVRIVGIWGMGGVGKTTIAKFIYNQLIPEFDYSSFLDDVREKSKSKGLESLQKQLLSDLTRHNHEDISNVDSGKYMFRDRFRHKKVLSLLDDIDRAELLNDLIPNVLSIAPKSRIIITTRDRSVLDEHQVKLIYRVPEISEDDSFLLFCKHAFRQDYPVAEFANLSWKMAKATGGLPLTIKAIASYLSYNLRDDVWVEQIGRLRKEAAIQERLMVSVDALDSGTKEIFLDIACFFNGMDSRVMVHVWRACRLSPVTSISDLVRKSLITVGDDHKIWMHDQLRDLDRDIVRAQNHILGTQSRLWCIDDVFQLLKNKEGTERVKAICLDNQELPGTTLVNGAMFQKLPNLEFLGLGSVNLDGQFEACLSRLKWLSWHGDTELSIPSGLHLEDLVVLDLSDSATGESWKLGWSLIMAAKQLEVLNLSSCHQLTKTPDFTSFPNLKRLILEDCRALAEVDPSLNHLKVLESLNVKNCFNLQKLPQELGSLVALTELIIDGTPIQEIPISSGMRNLQTLSCKFCKWLTQLPDAVRFLVKLRWLFLDHCKSLTEIPSFTLQLVTLEELNLPHTSVEYLPDFVDGLPSNLKVLDISYSKIRSLPYSLSYLEKLEVINASKCHLLEGEISLIGYRSRSLRTLRFDGTRISVLAMIIILPNLQTLDTEGCECLEALPSLPSSLVIAKVTSRSSMAVPNLSRLINLTELEFIQCMNLTYVPKEIENLSKLHKLRFHSTNISAIPEEIGKLAQLRLLTFEDCDKLQSLPELPLSLREVHIVRCSSLGVLPQLSNLKRLVAFSLLKCPQVSHIPGLYDLHQSLKSLKLSCHVVETYYLLLRLSSLSYLFLEEDGSFETLNLENQKGIFSIEIVHSGSVERIKGLSSLCILKSLRISNCNNLTEIEGIQGLISLEKLDISGCEAVKKLGYLSMLQNLKEVNLSGCKKLREIQGLHELPSLERLDISGCLSLPEVVHHPRAEIVRN